MSKWTSCTVQELVDRGEAVVKTGPFGTQLHASDYVDAGIPVINVRNIGFGGIRPEKLEYISEETAKRLSTHLLKPKDIVFGRKGAVERHVFIQNGQDRWFQGSDCLRLRVTGSSVDPRYVSYSFLSEDHKSWMMNQCSHGATMASLNQDIVKRIPLLLPALETQRKIASILSAYDDLIENNTRRIKILEEMARMIFREWFVNFRFPGHEQVRMVDSPLGMIPEGWEVRDLLDLSEVTYGFAFKADQFSVEPSGKPVVRIRDVLEGRSSTYSTEKPADKYLVQNGDILVGMDGDFHMGFWVGGEAYLVQRVARFRSKGDISNYHLFLAMEKPIQDFNATITGTTVAHLGDKHIKTIQVAWPDKALLAKANQVFDSMLKQILTLRLKNQNLRQTRDLLLPKLISGEVAV